MHFKPADGNTGNGASQVFYTTQDNITYAAVFNYSANSAAIQIDLARLGLSGSYTATELYSGTVITGSGSLQLTLPASDAHIYKITGATAGTDGATITKLSNMLFPNPATSSFKVRFAAPVTGNATITVSDPGGKQLWSTTVTINGNISPEIPVASLTNGFYLVTVTTAQQGTLNFKFIKQ